MKNQNTQSGFTLVEMGVVVLILGLIVGAFFAFYTPQLEIKRQQITIVRQEKVARALAEFALRTGRMPCPGLPYAVPTASPPLQLGDAQLPGNCSSSIEVSLGIVPFRTLGLSQSDAMDGYGNPFTYSIPEITGVMNTTTIHNQCRAAGTWVVLGDNSNDTKASVCCRRVVRATGTNSQIYVYTATPYNTANHVTPTTTNLPVARYGLPTVAAATTNEELNYIAYVLISHGKNGGAYVLGTGARQPIRQPVSAAETENIDEDDVFTLFPRRDTVSAGTEYFDDIVFWRTQRSMLNDIDQTCFAP